MSKPSKPIPKKKQKSWKPAIVTARRVGAFIQWIATHGLDLPTLKERVKQKAEQESKEKPAPIVNFATDQSPKDAPEIADDVFVTIYSDALRAAVFQSISTGGQDIADLAAIVLDVGDDDPLDIPVTAITANFPAFLADWLGLFGMLAESADSFA